MRYKYSQEQQLYLREASAIGNLELVYAVLDVLGSMPWQINRKIFDVILQDWDSGQRLGKLSSLGFDEPEPEPEKAVDLDPNRKARLVHLTKQKHHANDEANKHSDRCSVNYRIEIGRTFLGDAFCLPHNVFRGHASPIPPHLNHIGDDFSRGLLKFDESKPLGTTGLRWLKVHNANLFGYDEGAF